MIERLQRALQHVEEVPSEVQEQLAEIIEQHTSHDRAASQNLVGAWSDLPDTFDEMLDTLSRIRHESPPARPLDDQLAWMDQDEVK